MTLCQISCRADADQWSVQAGDACIGHLHAALVSWTCRDGALHLRLLSAEPLALPASEATEPRVAALARLAQFARAQGAYLILEQIASYDAEFYPHLNVCRFLALADDQDAQLWDAVLSLGMPMFAVRDDLFVDLMRPTVFNALQALLFGAYYCSNGMLLQLDERPHSCRVASLSDEVLSARVIVRGGMEIGQLQGTQIERDDQGNEGYVRLEIAAGEKQAWTQPRFVGMPEPA